MSPKNSVLVSVPAQCTRPCGVVRCGPSRMPVAGTEQRRVAAAAVPLVDPVGHVEPDRRAAARGKSRAAWATASCRCSATGQRGEPVRLAAR